MPTQAAGQLSLTHPGRVHERCRTLADREHRDGRPGVEFSWQGDDDGDPASGRGWAVLESDGSLRGRIYVHLGDDSGFHAMRAEIIQG